MSYGWPAYVSVAKRRENAEKEMNKLRKKGIKIEPVNIESKKITRTFWGNAWCEHIESFSDYDNRLPRGRTYVRNGSVCHLSVLEGEVKGIVSGSELYNIDGKIKPLSSAHWKKIKKLCSGQIGSVLELLQGKLSDNIMSIVTDPKNGLFPSPKEITLNCDCPDWADLCKHLAAALYAIGARLDQSPELLFTLRGVDHNELISTNIQIPTASKRRRITGDIADVFGIELNQASPAIPKPVKKSAKVIKAKSTKTKPAITKLKAPSKKPINTTAKKTALTKSKVIKSKVIKAKAIKAKAISPQRIQPKLATNKNTDNFKATGPAVRRLRKQLKMNKSEFARLVGVSAPSITLWESKRGKISLMEASLAGLTKASKLDN